MKAEFSNNQVIRNRRLADAANEQNVLNMTVHCAHNMPGQRVE